MAFQSIRELLDGVSQPTAGRRPPRIPEEPATVLNFPGTGNDSRLVDVVKEMDQIQAYFLQAKVDLVRLGRRFEELQTELVEINKNYGLKTEARTSVTRQLYDDVVKAIADPDPDKNAATDID